MSNVKKHDAQAVARRKSSVARVYLSAGSGKIVVNNREIKSYFCKGTDRYVVNRPLNLLKLTEKFDLKINVRGGGNTGFLTRDARKVERKKAGLKGARAKFQFSKR